MNRIFVVILRQYRVNHLPGTQFQTYTFRAPYEVYRPYKDYIKAAAKATGHPERELTVIAKNIYLYGSLADDDAEPLELPPIDLGIWRRVTLAGRRAAAKLRF